MLHTVHIAHLQPDARQERRLLESRSDRGDKTYRQMLADISLMA